MWFSKITQLLSGKTEISRISIVSVVQNLQAYKLTVSSNSEEFRTPFTFIQSFFLTVYCLKLMQKQVLY